MKNPVQLLKTAFMAVALLVSSVSAWAENVASVTIDDETTYYDSFNGVINAIYEASSDKNKPAKITLLKDCSNTNLVVAANRYVIFNGGSHTLTLTNRTDIRGDLVINSGTIKAADDDNLTDVSLFAVFGTLTVNGGVIDASTRKNAIVTGESSGDVKINGGTILGGTYALVISNASTGTVFTGGTLSAGSNAILVPESMKISDLLATDYIYQDYDGDLDSNKSTASVTIVSTYVAELTMNGATTNYTSFYKAVEAAFEVQLTQRSVPAAIKMIKDYTYNEDEKYSIYLLGTMSIDLNGKTITGNIDDDNVLNVLEGGSLTITDTSDDKAGAITNPTGGVVNCTYGALTIHAGTFNAGKGYALEVSKGTVSLDGGHYVTSSTATDAAAVKIVATSSALASGYFFSDSNSILTENTNGVLCEYGSNSKPAKDVTVTTPDAVNALAYVTIGDNTSYYGTIPDAFAAAAAGTASSPAIIKIQKSKNSIGNTTINCTSGVMTLDLNGCSISSNNTAVFLNGNLVNLTITDNSANGGGAISCSQGYAVQANEGTLTIKSGNFSSSTMSALSVDADVVVSLQGGHYTTRSDSYSAVTANCGTSPLESGYAYYDVYCNMLEDANEIMSKDGKGYASEIYVGKTLSADAFASLLLRGNKTDYASLSDALRIATAGSSSDYPAVIKILKSFALQSMETLDFNGGVIKLDLNGKTISGYSNEIMLVRNGCNLTITDESSDKKGAITNYRIDAVYASGSTLTVCAGTFKGGSPTGCGLRAEDCTVSLSGGHFTTTSKNVSALSIDSETSSLASGYMYYDDADYMLDDTKEILSPDGSHATDIYVRESNTNTTLTLDENATKKNGEIDPWDSSKIYDVKIKCTLNKGIWNSVCFPFVMTSDEIKTVFGEGTEVLKVKDCASNLVELVSSENIDTTEFYIVKPTKAVAAFCLYDKKLSNKWNYGEVEDEYEHADGSYVIISRIYKSGLSVADGNSPRSYVLYNNKFRQVDTEGSEIKGYKWQIQRSNQSLDDSTLSTNIDLGDVTTGIEEIENQKMVNSEAYNLAGQRVNASTKGLVIKNGKKYFVK